MCDRNGAAHAAPTPARTAPRRRLPLAAVGRLVLSRPGGPPFRLPADPDTVRSFVRGDATFTGLATYVVFQYAIPGGRRAHLHLVRDRVPLRDHRAVRLPHRSARQSGPRRRRPRPHDHRRHRGVREAAVEELDGSRSPVRLFGGRPTGSCRPRSAPSPPSGTRWPDIPAVRPPGRERSAGLSDPLGGPLPLRRTAPPRPTLGRPHRRFPCRPAHQRVPRRQFLQGSLAVGLTRPCAPAAGRAAEDAEHLGRRPHPDRPPSSPRRHLINSDTRTCQDGGCRRPSGPTVPRCHPPSRETT